jgi:hypothetical protein
VAVEAPGAPGSLEFVQLFSGVIDPLSFAARIRVGIRETQIGLNAIDQRSAAPVVRFLTAVPAIFTIVTVIIAITVAILRIHGQRHQQQAAASHRFHEKTSHSSFLLLPKDAQGAGGGAGAVIIYR